jgi:hypothetical protein
MAMDLAFLDFSQGAFYEIKTPKKLQKPSYCSLIHLTFSLVGRNSPCITKIKKYLKYLQEIIMKYLFLYFLLSKPTFLCISIYSKYTQP